jgi:alpha/beta superfamily hydrolase
MESHHRKLTIAGPAGDLEALLWAPLSSNAPPMAAVVCHPHPLFGGTMHNKVVYQSAKTLHSFGLAVLRFNFRGVGLSQGAYDRGRGEEGDVNAALDYLAAEFPSVPLLVAGFSFGAWVGLRVGCADHRVSELVGLGLPVNDPALDFAYLRGCGKPKLILQGAEDQFAAREKVEALIAGLNQSLAGATRVAFVPGGDHFFTGHIHGMTSALAQWFAERHPNLRVSLP